MMSWYRNREPPRERGSIEINDPFKYDGENEPPRERGSIEMDPERQPVTAYSSPLVRGGVLKFRREDL